MDTARLKTVSEQTGPAVLGAGVALLTVALITSGHTRVAAAPAPTVTVTAPAPEPARTTVVARPSTSPAPAGAVPVSDRTTAMPHTAGGSQSHAQARPPSATTPSPTSPAAAPCSGQVLTVRLLQACVSIGGGS